ncbi:PAP2-domain-containing protein, partial [Suhomyces tanzawaensis NRRL Y-17324]
YLRSKDFVRFGPDWILAVGLIVYFFFIAEHANPFNRQFTINDLSISHPFAEHERVTGINCLLIGSVIPSTVITVVTIFKRGRHSTPQQWLHFLQISLLALVLSFVLSGLITDILKNWISRPRPDFLARCGPKKGTPADTLVDVGVCTAPLGWAVLTDGMRSTPSGHSSISFGSLLYLTLWLLGQFQLVSPATPQPVYKSLLCGLPVLLATYVGLSRTQDYRHHFMDVFLGTTLGCTVAVTLYRRYFVSLWSEDSSKANDVEEDLLP